MTEIPQKENVIGVDLVLIVYELFVLCACLISVEYN